MKGDQGTSSWDAPPHLERFKAFAIEMTKETPRGMAMASAAFIDEMLGEILAAFMVDNKGAAALLDGVNAPLGTFAARAAAANAMGLISDAEHRECDLVRKVRNEFAHQVLISFEDEKLMKLCAKLTYAAKPYGDVTVSTHGQFASAATALIMNLVNRAHYVKQKRLVAGSWPY